MWVLITTNNGSYSGLMIAKSGRKSSFTNNIKNARKYDTEELARADACGNEYPKHIDPYEYIK